MSRHPPTLSHWASALCLVASFACGAEKSTTPTPSTADRPLAGVAYDGNGNPLASYYSSTVTRTKTGSDSVFDPPAQAYERSYVDEYTWSPSAGTWDNRTTFSTGDLPFGTSAPPQIDVARAEMTFGATTSDIRDRSGATVTAPTSTPSTYADTVPMSSPPLVPPQPPPPPPPVPPPPPPVPPPPPPPPECPPSCDQTPPVAPEGTGFTAAMRRGARIERLVATPQTSARVLAQLRQSFVESVGGSGMRLFTQQRGGGEVRVTFDPALGGITRTVSIEQGRRLAETVYRYTAIDGGHVLSEIITTVYGPDGKPGSSYTQRYNNVSIQ